MIHAHNCFRSYFGIFVFGVGRGKCFITMIWKNIFLFCQVFMCQTNSIQKRDKKHKFRRLIFSYTLYRKIIIVINILSVLRLLSVDPPFRTITAWTITETKQNLRGELVNKRNLSYYSIIFLKIILIEISFIFSLFDIEFDCKLVPVLLSRNCPLNWP